MGDRVCRLKQDVMAFFVASGPGGGVCEDG